MPSAAYPTVLLKTLQGRYPSQASSIIVANYGLGGEKAINARDRFFQALNIVRPEVVLLLEGHNDIAGGLDGAASGAASEMRIMAAEARNCAACASSSRTRRRRGPAAPHHRPALHRRLQQPHAGTRRHEGAVLVDIYSALLPDVTRYIGVDGLHPTEAGYAKIADTFFQAIQANLEVR